MPFGRLYGYQDNPRSRGILVAAKVNAIDLEIMRSVPREGFSENYLKLNKLGRIPTFEGSDGFVLTEAIAIAVYVASQNDHPTLLGDTKKEFASILQWMSFFNSEVQGPLGTWWRMLMNIDAHDDSVIDIARENAHKALDAVESHLAINSNLVGRYITLADYFCAGILSRGLESILDELWQSQHSNIIRWFDSITSQPAYKEAIAKSTLNS